MNKEVLDAIELIGGQLDQGVLPRVGIGGLIKPAVVGDVFEQAGEEKQDETHGWRRSSARQGQRTARWKRAPRGQRATGGSRPARPATPSLGHSHEAAYQAQAEALAQAYPELVVQEGKSRLWLFLRSPLIPGLPRTAAILVFVPYEKGSWPSAWAYWEDNTGHQWIGPRHTNFPEGSICAFDRGDGTWLPGGSLVLLLDLYCLWVFRHLYMELKGRWPGSQSATHPFERLVELKDDEMCGCLLNQLRYKDCCKKNDLLLDLVALSRDFRIKYGDLRGRCPPPLVSDFFKTPRVFPEGNHWEGDNV